MRGERWLGPPQAPGGMPPIEGGRGLTAVEGRDDALCHPDPGRPAAWRPRLQHGRRTPGRGGPHAARPAARAPRKRQPLEGTRKPAGAVMGRRPAQMRDLALHPVDERLDLTQTALAVDLHHEAQIDAPVARVGEGGLVRIDARVEA